MKKRIRSFVTGLTFRIVFGVMILLFLVNVITGCIGYWVFTKFFTEEYSESAYHTAETASILVDGDRIDDYLAGGGTDESYQEKLSRMNNLCVSQHLNVIYVIKPDVTDYGRYISVFNAVSPESGYTPWEVGRIVNTENEEYRAVYREICEDGTDHKTLICPSGVDGSMPFVTAFMPVRNASGEVTAILCVQRPMEALVNGRRAYLCNIALSILAVTVFAAVILTGFLKRQYVTPTKNIISEAKRFSVENRVGDFFTTQNKSYTHGIHEIKEMNEALFKMETDTMQYMEELKTATATHERLSTELSLATHIQANMLPCLFPPFPGRKEFDIYATMTPAKEVGGDFYDFFLLDDDHLGVVMADVSGKGIPAALFMMATKILIKSHAMNGGTPAQVLEAVNAEICKTNADSMFVTVWFGVLTISTGVIIAANAGHEYPIIKQADGSFNLMKEKHGLFVGGMDGARYKDYSFTLKAGDALFLYTDGVTEATDAEGRMFGTERLLAALNRNPDTTVHEVLDAVHSEISSFVMDAEQFDDVTMLCLKMLDEETENRITISPDTNGMMQVSAFVESTSQAWGLPQKTKNTLQTVSDEVFSNIVRYSKASTVVVTMQRKKDCVMMSFADDGIEYDPTLTPEPNTSLSVDERQIGGLGIFMMKQLMDDVTYKYESQKNILILKKYL